MHKAFEAIVGEEPKVLILGSMPGVKSLDEQQYYAHPQNAFWFIMRNLFLTGADEAGSGDVLEYHDRLSLLRDHHIALWDVIAQCHRPGSLDSDIDQHSLIANDFAAFFECYPSISRVCFNGRSVETLFKRHVLKKQGAGAFNGQFHTFPSTSPANARLSKYDKLEQWRVLVDFLQA